LAVSTISSTAACTFSRRSGPGPSLTSGESDDHKRQSFFAVLQRIESSNDYFARVWKLQPKFIAIFGEKTEDIFDQLHKARRDIEATASTMVFEDEPFDLKDPAYREELKGYRTTSTQWLALPLRRLAIGGVQPGARHLDLHLAETPQQRPRPVAVAVTSGADHSLRIAARRLRTASVVRARQNQIELAFQHGL
jgi:hypothetical protein